MWLYRYMYTFYISPFYVCRYSSFQVQFPACWLYQSDFDVAEPSDFRRALQTSVLAFTHIADVLLIVLEQRCIFS